MCIELRLDHFLAGMVLFVPKIRQDRLLIWLTRSCDWEPKLWIKGVDLPVST